MNDNMGNNSQSVLNLDQLNQNQLSNRNSNMASNMMHKRIKSMGGHTARNYGSNKNSIKQAPKLLVQADGELHSSLSGAQHMGHNYQSCQMSSRLESQKNAHSLFFNRNTMGLNQELLSARQMPVRNIQTSNQGRRNHPSHAKIVQFNQTGQQFMSSHEGPDCTELLSSRDG